MTVFLLAVQTPAADLARFAAYAVFAVILPGTLLYRALRRHPHTLVEDVAMGAALGLTLELAAWALFAALDQLAWVGLWPLAVLTPFAAVPRWRRHWWVRGYAPTLLAWSWTVAGVVVAFIAYVSAVFLQRNPILPLDEDTRQYIDLPYHLSLAGEMTHNFPPNLPQVAGEPLHYHWFGHVHMAMSAMVGQIDLPVVTLRLAVPALCALAIVLSAVVGWRVSGRPLAGAVTAVLFWTIYEIHFANPLPFAFGTQVGFVVWHGMSMVYSWVLLLALIAILAEMISRSGAAATGAPASEPAGDGTTPMWTGAYVLTALLAFASSGAKASSLPVVLAALAFTAVVLFVGGRRLPRLVISAAAIVGVAELFALTVLFRSGAYGLELGAFDGLARYWMQPPSPRPPWEQGLRILTVSTAYVINTHARMAGIVSLIWLRRARLLPVQCFLLGGVAAGHSLYFSLTGSEARYFSRAGFAFGVILSAWGYALVWERARLSRRAAVLLTAGAAAFTLALTVIQLRAAGRVRDDDALARILPILEWSGALATAGVLGALVWWACRSRWPALRGRGALVTLTAILAAGAPGMVIDAVQSEPSWNSPSVMIVLPRSQVEAARWVREHSRPDDILATNAHCLRGTTPPCNPRSFWLSAYAERTVLVEGWGFAPRLIATKDRQFWNRDLLRLNDRAFTAPTPARLEQLRREYGVRWMVVDRTAGHESAELRALAVRRFDNGRIAVYELGTVPVASQPGPPDDVRSGSRPSRRL